MVSSKSIPISYQLVIEVRAPVRCEVGRLGVFDFPAGTYVYTGSARRGFEARLARHTRATKALRWHIDYLLTAPGVRIVKIVRSGRDECRLNRAVNGTVWVPGFGASDCTVGCGAHLKYRGPLAGSLPTARVTLADASSRGSSTRATPGHRSTPALSGSGSGHTSCDLS